MTQQQLADLVDIQAVQISRYEVWCKRASETGIGSPRILCFSLMVGMAMNGLL